MATEAESEIAESLSLTKREGEDKDLISRQLETTVDEYCCPRELKKVEGGHNEPPETVEDSANRDTMQAAIPIGDETVSTIIEGNVETLEGKSFLESPSVANIASEETCRVSEHHWADEKPNQTEKEISENEIQLQKDQKFEDLEETGCEKNKAVEETKERAEKGNDSIDIVSVIETGLEKTKTGEPALKVEEEETLMKQLILDQNVEIVAKRQASIEREPLSIEEAIRPPLTLLKDMTPIKDEIQDKNNLDTPFVIQTEEMCLQKEEKPEIFKEVSEIGSEGVVKESPKEVEDQTKIPQKTAQADSTTPEKGKDDESPEQKVDDSFIQREESKQIKSEEGLAMPEASAVENRNEDKFTVVVTEGNTSNTEIAGAEEHMIKETSKYEEDPEQSFLQHDEPKKEKLERSSNVISESENAETITCLKEERSINNLEESFEEKGREDKPTDTDDISEHVIPTEKNFPPIDLNEKIDSAEVEIPEKNVNALHVTHSLVEETEQVERENVDAVSKFEPQEEVNEANGASTDEEKQIEKASEPCKITESTTSEHTSKEVAATKELISSKIDAEKLQKINGLDSEEKIEVGDAGENIEEETQKNEEAFAADMHKITTSDDTQEGIIEEDAPVKDCSNVGSADETVEQSFQVESLDDAAPELINNSNKVEDDVERNSTIDEEVHDIPKTTGEGEITKEYDIEGNVGQSKRIKDEKDEERQIPHDGIRDVSISTVTENPDMQNDEEAILEIGEGAKDKLDTPPLTLPKDITPIEYEVQDKNNLDTPCVIQTEEMCLQKGEKPEIFNEFSEIGSEDVVKENSEEVEDQTEIPEKTTQADSPMSEKGKDDENPEQKVDGSFIKHEESKQIKIEGLVMTEASARENRNEDEFTVIEAEKEINNTEISKADEHRRNETSIHKEDPEQSFLQHDDPKEEKLERSLNVNSEMTEVAAPSENVETITCVQEGSSINNLEESFEEKEKEDKPTDTNEISEHGILREKNFQPIDLNEKIESAEIEIPEKNVNDSHVKRSLGGETEPMECEKHDKVSKFQPQEVNEANEASTEEVKQIEEASEGCKSTERTALGHTSTEEAATKELISSEKDAEELQKIYGLDSEEKSEVENAGENIEEETQKNEEAFDTEMHKSTTKSDDPEKCTIAEDAPVKFFSTVDAGDETVEQSFQVESLEEAAPELNGDNKAYKEEDDVERNNLIDEEVHDGPTTAGTGELTEGHILESNVGPSKKIEEEKDEGKQIPNDGIRDVAISTITENPEIQNDEEEILEIGEGAKDKVDCPLPTLLKDNTSVEDEIQDKNNLDSPLVIETEEMYLQKPQKPEILKEVSESGPEDVVKESPKPKEVEDQTEILEKTAQADSTTNEKGKDDENPEQKLADSFIEQSFLQHSEPKNEKLETSLNVISEMMETATSSENAETITCVKDEISIKNLEQSFEEKGKEDKPTDTDDIREHGIPIEKLDLNEKTESAEVEIPERKVNDLHITHLLVEETEQVECGKLEEVSKFQPQEEFNEANGASAEEEKPIEEASEACKSTERTTLEHLSTEETKKNEALDTDMHQISMKIDDTEKGIIEEDAPTEVCRAVGMGDETVEQSFQGERLEEAAPELNGDNTSYKVEDNVERNSIVDEEVHGGPMITGKGDVTKEHMIEHNVRYITPELIEEETTKSFQDNETKAEGSKGEDAGEDTKEQIIEEGNVIDLSPESFAEGPVKNFQDDEKEAEKSKEEIVEEGNVIDLSPESVAEGPVKNFQDDEKEEEKFKEEIFEDSETAEPGEGIACETIQDDEIPGKNFYPSSVKQVERLQGEEDLSPMEASGGEKRDEDGSFVMVTGDEDNITRLVNVKENTEKETPKDDEDAKQILQQDEPGEKLERSLIVMSEETEEGVTSEDAGKFTCMREEADVRNLEETLEEEIKEAAKDTDDTKGIGIAKEEDLELVAEESGASKSTESTDLELNSKESETEVEELINGCKLDSKEELEDKDASKNVGEETKNEETSDLSLHKVETENASAEKSMEDVDGTVKDSSTVCIGEEVVELNCPEDENAQKSTEEAEPKSNGGDQSYKTDNETENLKNKFVNEEVYESPRVASMGEDIEEHIIQKEHTATDIIPESNGEDIFKSSEEDEKEEEKSKVEAFETISAGQNTREQIMEIDSVTDHPPESTEKETLEESPKEDKVCEEFETTASSTTTIKQNIEECATPDLSSLSVGEETIRESSEEDGNKSDAIELTEEVKSYKAEDDADWNNIIEKKVHDEPKIPSTEEVITEDTIDSNVQYISPELTKDETVKSFQDNEKEEERSKGEDTKEKIIGKGNVIDLSPESIAEGPVKNFEDNGKEAEKFKGELEEESETAEAVMSIAREIYKDDESSERIFHASSSVKQEERLQGEGEDLSPTKASEGEKREVDKSTIMVTGDEDNITNLVKVEENSENKTSKDDEDAKQILQKDEPVEKLERSINVMTEETEEGFPSVNVEKLTCMKEEASVQNLQETMEIEIKEEVKDTHDTEDNGIAKEEAHDGPKIAGMGEDTEKQILQEHTVRDISPESIGEETSKSPKEDDKVEETRVETCEELATTTGGEGTEKQNLEEEYPVKNQSTVSVNVETNEESSKEDDMVVKIPKQEGGEIIQTADGGEDTGKHIMEEDNAVRDNFELKVFETTGAGQDTREQIINKIDSVEDHSPESIEKETLGASSKEDEEGEGFKTTASSMNTEKQNKEECATPHVSLLSVGEETAIESSNGGESDAVKLKEEVKESYLEFIQQTEARSFMEETKFEALKERENINKDLEEEMPPKETNENLVEHSLVSEASEKENKTETSEKEESTVNHSDSALVTIVTDEKCLRDAETEDKKQNLESDDLGKKLECTSESVAEDQSNKPLPEISQTQIEEHNDEGRDQTIESVANESIKDVILTEKVPEGTEKGDENENIKEQITQRESATKELHTVSSIDEADIEGKNSDPVSIDNLKPTDSNEQIETMNLEVEEDLDREQEASPLTKASEKETMEQVGKEKTADVSISVSEVSEEKIKEEIKEQADNCYDKLETASVNTVTKEKSLGEPQPDDKWGKALNNSFQEASNDEAILDLGCSNKITDGLPTTHSFNEEILQEVGEKCEEASNLQLDETKKALESASKVQSYEILTESEEAEIKEEHHEAAKAELRAEENQSEKCDEASNLQLDETEKALESAFKVQSDEILTESEETEIKEKHHEAATAELRAEENPFEKCEEASNLQLDETEKALEPASKVQSDEILTELEETEIKEENHEAATAELRNEENQSEKCEEASKLELDKTEKALECASKVQSRETFTESEETKIKEVHHEATTAELRAEEKQSEKCEEASNLELDKTEKALESASEVQSDETLIKSEETEIKEEHHEAATAELRAEENRSEKCEEASNLQLNEPEKALESTSEAQSREILTESEETEIKEEHHKATMAELRAEENQSEKCEEASNLQLNEPEKALESASEVQSREILTESEDTEIKEEHHEAAMVELRAEENQSEKCEEASNLQLDETEKALESASKVQSREILTESEEAEIKEEHHKAAMAKLRAEENQPEKYEEASNLQLDETEKALEFATKVQNDETLTKSEETEIKEEHHEATMAELRAEENQSEECEEASNVKLDKKEKALQSPSEVQSSEILTESKETKIKEEHHDAATAKLRAEENQSEKCEEASNLELDKTEKALESESEVQSDEILTESEETAIKEEHHEPTTAELRAEENWSEKCEEASNLELDKTEKALESASKVQSDEIFTKSQEIDIKEEHNEAATAELSAEENQTEANEIVKNEVSNEELSDEIEKTSASRNIIKQTTHEDRALGDPYLVSVWDETLKESFPDEAEEKNVEEAEIKLNLENQGDTTNLRDSKTAATTLSEEVIIELEKRDLDTLGTDDKKETAITKTEEGPNTNLGVPPDTNAAAEEVPHERVGDESEKASEPYPTELVHETNIIHKEDEEIATVVADNQESIMEDQKQEHTSLALSRDGTNVKEDLKLKGDEVYDIKSGTSSANKISQEEIPDKNSTITEDEKQHDLVFDEETAAELGIPAEGKGIKDEREHAKNEEPKEVSTRENESKPDEVEIHSTTCANEDTEIQYQSQKPDDLAHIQDSGLVMSPKEGSVVLAEAIVTSQDIPTLEKNSPSISEKQILRETDPSEITETMVSTGNKDALLVVQDPEGKTSQKAEVKGLEPENASEIESEWNEETSKESTPMDAAKISLSNLQQRSTKETLQTAGQVTEEKEPMSNKELQIEEVETLQVEATKTNEEKDEEEEGDEHKKEDSGSDAPVMVEASRDMDVKVSHKKSHHNILSGVGSKVKHSIAKVKKAITGKSSHPKPISPK